MILYKEGDIVVIRPKTRKNTDYHFTFPDAMANHSNEAYVIKSALSVACDFCQALTLDGEGIRHFYFSQDNVYPTMEMI